MEFPQNIGWGHSIKSTPKNIRVDICHWSIQNNEPSFVVSWTDKEGTHYQRFKLRFIAQEFMEKLIAISEALNADAK